MFLVRLAIEKRGLKIRWFKHLSGSLNNSFIFELIEKYGGDGYLVFFGILEMMADEFDVKNPGISRFSIKKLTKNLQISTRKLKVILYYISEKGAITAEYDGQYIILTCLRLRVLSDNWTQKLLRSNLKAKKKLLQPKEVRSKKKEVKSTKEKKDIKKEKTLRLDFIYLTEDEHKKLINRFGERTAEELIGNANSYAHQIGIRKFNSKYKSHYYSILNWARMNNIPEIEQKPEEKSERKHFEGRVP